MFHFSKDTLIIIFGISMTFASAQNTTSRALESEPFSCYSALDCGECVSNGCGWAVGECFNSCDEIADVSCYDAESGATSEEVCGPVSKQEKNKAICNAQTGSGCAACTNTSLIGGDENCYWLPEWQTCEPELSNAWTMGVSVCLGPEDEKCFLAGLDGCRGCLENGCEWDGTSCVPSCGDIADGDCYSPQYFVGQSTEDICLVADTQAADYNLCEWASSDCEMCTSTKKSDGLSMCQWYSDDVTGESWCGTGGCDMLGTCGQDTCTVPDNKVELEGSCATRKTCGSCLSEASTCAWVQGSCLESCDIIADTACYTLGPGQIGEDICQLVEEREADEETCSSVDSCQECTSTLKADRKSTCSWYTADEGESPLAGWCGTGGCDFLGICGFSDSKKCPAPAGSTHGNVRGGKHRSSFLDALLP